jgi:hypothetical protein
MKVSEVKELEKIMGQMEGLHKELGALARKSPNDGLNRFKLSLVNSALDQATKLLGAEYIPVTGFTQFNPDDLPTNSDVTLVVSQYLEELERKRADNIKRDAGLWIYNIEGSLEKIRTAPPKKINEKK